MKTRDDRRRVEFGTRLAGLREKFLRLDQQAMAKALGVTQGQVSHYEQARRSPSLEVLAKLQDAFAVNLNWLLTGEGYWRLPARAGAAATARKPRPPLHPDDEELLDLVRRRLERPYSRWRFSAPVSVVLSESASGAQPRRARPRFRALPCTSDALAVDKSPLKHEKIEGHFVLAARLVGSPENVRCLRVSDDRFVPTFPKGSIVGVDVGAQVWPPKDLQGKVLLLDWERTAHRRRRVLARLTAFDPAWAFAPLDAGGDVPDREDVEAHRVRVVGHVAWAWHTVE